MVKIHRIRNNNREIVIDGEEIRNYFTHFNANASKNIEDMDTFLEKYSLAK